MNKIFKRNKCRYEDSAVGKRATWKEVERFIESLEVVRGSVGDDYMSPLEKELLEDLGVLYEKHSDEEVYS